MQTPRRPPVGGLALLAVAVLAVALLLWNLAGPSPRSATQPTPSEASAAAQGETAAKPQAAPAAPSPAAGTAERTAAPLPEGGMHIRGRCLAAESGAPLGGCRVDLFDAPAREGSSMSSGPYRPDATTATAADGTFAFERASAGPRTLTLYLRADGRGVATRQWPRANAGDLDCGDVPLALGAVLTGRAVDERGAPVARVLVHFALERQDAWRQQSVLASSGDDGALRTNDVLPAGHWQVEVPSEHGLLRPDALEVLPGAATAAIDVVVRRTEELPVLSGIAVDARGAPVPRVLLQGNRQHGTPLQTTTAGDGSFAFRRKDADEEPVRLDVLGRWLQDPDAVYAWGTRDVQVVVLEPPTVRLRVVDVHGVPVLDFAARFAGGPPSGLHRLSPAQVRERLHHGALVLRELPPHRYAVSVLPSDPGRGCCAPVEWELQQGAERQLALQPPAPLRVLLRRQDAPVAGSRVQLLRSESGKTLRLDCPTVTLAETFAGREPDAGDGVVVDEGTTAADGSVLLHAPPGEVLAVRALGPGHAAVLQADVAMAAGGSELVLQVAAGATVSGRLLPRDVFERLLPREQEIRAAFGPEADVAHWQESRAPRLWLHETSGERRRLPIWPPLGQRCDATGAFRFDAVPAGDWRLELWYWRGLDRRGGDLRQLDLATLSLRDGDVRCLDLDVSATQASRVDGLVLVDGRPWPDGRARLGEVEVHTDADGRFAVGVEAGRHWLELLPPGDGERLPYCGPAVDVGGGVSVDATFDMRRRSLQVRVLEADGAAAKGRLILLRGGLQVDAPPQDADGWIAIDPMPPRPVELVVYPPGFDAAARAATPLQQRLALVTRLGPIEVAAGRQQARVELRMPPGK